MLLRGVVVLASLLALAFEGGAYGGRYVQPNAAGPDVILTNCQGEGPIVPGSYDGVGAVRICAPHWAGRARADGTVSVFITDDFFRPVGATICQVAPGDVCDRTEGVHTCERETRFVYEPGRDVLVLLDRIVDALSLPCGLFLEWGTQGFVEHN